MSRNRNLTIREGTSEKNWYFLAGYVALGIITVLLTITTIVQGGSYSIGAMIGLLIMAISVLGLGTYLALFKDAAYIRDTRSRWGPKWWYYIGAVSELRSLFILLQPRYPNFPDLLAWSHWLLTR